MDRIPHSIDILKMLAAIIRHAPVYLVLIDRKLKMVWLNRSLDSDPSEHYGKHVATDAHPEDKGGFIGDLKNCFKTGIPKAYLCRSKWNTQFAGKMCRIGDHVLLIIWEHQSKDGAKLTARESEIAEMVKRGLSSKQIGESLNISKHTVDNHRKKIKNKTSF